MTSKIIREIKEGLVVGLVVGLVYGLVVGLVTQIIAYLTSNPQFSIFDFWGSLVGLIIVQVIGEVVYFKLKNAGDLE